MSSLGHTPAPAVHYHDKPQPTPCQMQEPAGSQLHLRDPSSLSSVSGSNLHHFPGNLQNTAIYLWSCA